MNTAKNLEQSKSAVESKRISPLFAALTGLILTFFGIFVALVLVEVAFRLIPTSKISTWDDRPKTYFRPETATTLQDFTYAKQKMPGTFRIAVVGDSFTFGPYLQFDDTFVKRLERWLNLNQNQPKVEVINYGVPRYSTSHEIPVVKRAIEEQADLILMQITLNDPEIKLDWPTELMPDESGAGLKPKGWIFDHWKSLAYVVTRVRNRESQNAYRDYFFKLFEGKRTWEQFSNSWKEIVKLGSESKKPVIAVVFPLFGMVVDDQYPFFPLHEKVGKFLDEIGVKHLDVTENFRDIPIDRLQVVPVKDRHPNEIGHRIAAEAILQWLPTTGNVPPEILPRGIEPQRIGIYSKAQKNP